LFKDILLPVSSEFYVKEVLERSAIFAQKYKSTIHLIYIIEEKTLNQTNKMSDAYRTQYDIAQTKKEIIREQVQTADNIVFDDADFFFKNKKIPLKEKIIEGEFSKVIINEVHKKKYDLILMGFEKECILNYRLFDEAKIPIWIESGKEINSILAVCSNLAPNQKVPKISVKLAESLKLDLNMIYVVDTRDLVHVDENGKRFDKKNERDIIFQGQNFVSNIEKKGIKIKLINGKLEKETIKYADKIGANLIIMGREQKKKNVLGLPAKSIRRKVAEKCKYSILFTN
jgi:nucleotide-binding universal stress UspA family protein